jgi:regulator of protease activity HflC (stomatin/prohibitin superfamily)
VTRAGTLPIVNTAALVVVAALAVLVGIAAISLRRSWIAVPEGHWALVERLGRYRRTLVPGRYLLVPTLDLVRALVPMGEQVLGFSVAPAITADNRTLVVDVVLRYRVVDPVRAVYEIADRRAGLEQLTVFAVRAHLGGVSGDDVLGGSTDTSPALRAVIEPQAEAWGIKIDDLAATPRAG